MRNQLCAFLLMAGAVGAWSMPLLAQDSSTPVSIAEYLDLSRQLWTAKRDAASEATARLQATEAWREADTKTKALRALEQKLNAAIKAKTGKVLDFSTGQLKSEGGGL